MGRISPLLTSRKILNISYATPQETLLATPVTLPTAEPATPQISYTVATADLPTFNMPLYQKKWVAMIYGSGKTVTQPTLSYNMKKNGASVSTGSGLVGAGYYYVRNCFFYDVAVGDVLELALWSDQTDTNWDYKAYQIQATRLILLNKPRLLLPCNFASLAKHPTLTAPYAYPYYTGNVYPYHLDKLLPYFSVATLYESLYPKDTYGLFRLYCGDYYLPNSSIVAASLTWHPYYYNNYVPTQLIMRGVKGAVEP